jgi:hypothetical protein
VYTPQEAQSAWWGSKLDVSLQEIAILRSALPTLQPFSKRYQLGQTDIIDLVRA